MPPSGPSWSRPFPDAPVLLSVRDLDGWCDNAAATVFATSDEDSLHTAEQQAFGATWAAVVRNRFVENSTTATWSQPPLGPTTSR